MRRQQSSPEVGEVRYKSVLLLYLFIYLKINDLNKNALARSAWTLVHHTSYSLTMSGMWSLSSSFCCLFSSVSMQWWQQRIFSSSFSSSMEVTLLRLLRLPLLEPIPLAPAPEGGAWDWPGLPGMQRDSLVPLVSLSGEREGGRENKSEKERNERSPYIRGKKKRLLFVMHHSVVHI